jgi:acyl-coenzyme A thioesterase PaaI-like protein
MTEKPIQDLYLDEYAHCYGCGKNNPQGMHLKSYQEGEECVCRFTPESCYTGGVPGYLYGGMIASLIDCHGAGTASVATADDNGEPVGRFVTASLSVDYHKPTPMGVELVIRGRAIEIKGRKVTVELQLFAGDVHCATGRVLMIQILAAT